MNGKILILGKNGQVGSALVRLLGTQALAADSKTVDFLSADFIPQLEDFVKNAPISAVINAAAYTQVDKAEGVGREAALRINGAAVMELAGWCKKRALPLIHYSTDYVFDGSGNLPYREEDKPAPINAYGESKLAGENAIIAAGGAYTIFRTSWVYDAHGKNFFGTILRLMKEKESLNVVADQFGAPTYAPHLAQATIKALSLLSPLPLREGAGGGGILEKNASLRYPPSLTLPLKGGGNIFHLCGRGETSWHGFAQAILALAKTCDSSIKCRQINPIPSSEYKTPAKRPHNSRLNCSKALGTFGTLLPHWEEGLGECIREKYAGSKLHDIGIKNHPA